LKTWEQANKNEGRYYRGLTGEIINFFQFTLEPTTEDRETKIAQDKQECEENQGKYCMVAGPYGTNNLENGGDQDCYLNEVFAAGQTPNDQNKVNNPRELLKLIDTADVLDFQNLLDLAAAKFASSIRRNDLYRLRAIYGFSPNGDYTEFTYTMENENSMEPNEIKGMRNLLHENTWFNPLNANEEYRRNAAGENANNAACTCAVNHDYTPESGAASAYEQYPTGYIQYTDTTGKSHPRNQMM